MSGQWKIRARVVCTGGARERSRRKIPTLGRYTRVRWGASRSVRFGDKRVAPAARPNQVV